MSIMWFFFFYFIVCLFLVGFFFLFFALNWTSNVCGILYAFLFDVGKLRLGYLMILLYLENVYYYY